MISVIGALLTVLLVYSTTSKNARFQKSADMQLVWNIYSEGINRLVNDEEAILGAFAPEGERGTFWRPVAPCGSLWHTVAHFAQLCKTVAP